MYYYVLLVTNLLLWQPWQLWINKRVFKKPNKKQKHGNYVCMVNFVNKLPKSKEKGHSLSHFYNIDHRQISYVCVGLQLISSKLPFNFLPNIWLTWLPWQQYIGFILWENKGTCIFLNHFYNIYHRKKIWWKRWKMAKTVENQAGPACLCCFE